MSQIQPRPEAHSQPEYFIGVLSGTSVDGIDCALVDFSSGRPQLTASHFHEFPAELRRSILSLCNSPSLSFDSLGREDVRVARAFSEAINTLLQRYGVDPAQILAVGSHGQTVHHQPAGDEPFTVQIGDPNTLTELTGITTIADFRRRDMAAGGQGAPLAPLFHQAFFHCRERRRAVVNIGGIANISALAWGTARLSGYDSGPGNVLMDAWIGLNQSHTFDRDGEWASKGRINPQLLDCLLDEAYFSAQPPKSTGRELFNLRWLEQKLSILAPLPAEDVQATLLELTARTISDAIQLMDPAAKEVFICGGGAHNSMLMRRLQQLLGEVPVTSSEQLGISPDWVEAMLFAWLARETWYRRSIDCRSVTGARHPCVMGGIYVSESVR